MFSCRNLSFRYGDKMVLRDISFRFSKGALVGLFGRNGSGKSTLLKMLGASLPILGGELIVFGENALDKRNYVKPSLRHLFGVLLQDFSSDEKISLFDNLFFAARLMGLDPKAAHSASIATLKLADLIDKSDHLLKTLSGGMRRRLEFYRTFMHKPRVILLDEPTASLDADQSNKALEFLRSYQHRHDALVIFSTHRPSEGEMCDEVIMMDEGRILAKDAPQKFLADLNFLACSFQLKTKDSKDDLAKAGVKLLSTEDSLGDPLTSNAHLTQAELSRLLADRDLFLETLHSFFVSKPSLSDAYVGLRGSR